VTPVPLDLPLRPSEAAELAILIFDQAERKPLNDEVRNRLAARAAVLRLETVTPYFGSLVRDPVHPSSYYLAVDAARGEPLLLHLALATAPTSSIFYKLLLIGRMRRPNGAEIVINSVPFGASDFDNLEKFVSQIGAAFLPRPQGSRSAIAVSSGLPAAFAAFRAILKRSGKNLAATAASPAVSNRDFYYAGLCAAIRAGWREGYTAGIHLAVAGERLSGNSVRPLLAPAEEGSCAGGAMPPCQGLEAARETIRGAAGFTKFSIDASSLFREPENGPALEEQFERSFTAEERGWIFDDFVRPFDLGDAVYEFTTGDALRLAVKFGHALKTNEHLHDCIRQARSALKTGRSFDFEPSLEGAATVTTPQELVFWLHWLKARGHGAQLAAPNVSGNSFRPLLAPVERGSCAGGAVPPCQGLGPGDGPAQRLKEFAAIARHYQCTLSIRSGAGHSPEALETIARATIGRVNYRLSPELRLPPESPEYSRYIIQLAEQLVV
jgi:hypothetical protein